MLARETSSRIAGCRLRNILEAREHTVDHHPGLAQIVGRVEEPPEGRPVEVTCNLGRLGQYVDERTVLRDRAAAKVVDKIVGALAPEVGTEPHHDGFGHDEPAGEIDVCTHASRVHLEPAQKLPRLSKCAGDEAERLWKHDPLDLTRAR